MQYYVLFLSKNDLGASERAKFDSCLCDLLATRAEQPLQIFKLVSLSVKWD